MRMMEGKVHRVVAIVKVVGTVTVMRRVRLKVVMRRRMYVWRSKMMRAIWAGRLISQCRLLPLQ